MSSSDANLVFRGELETRLRRKDENFLEKVEREDMVRKIRFWRQKEKSRSEAKAGGRNISEMGS